MMFLAVSAPLNQCRNPSEELHGRCRQEFLSKPFLQGSLVKKTGRQSHLQQHQDVAIVASSSFPSFRRGQSSSASSLSASILTPSSSTKTSTGGREVYQPFRPPPPVMPALENISIDEQLQILRERRGLWFDYAIHVPSLIRAGFAPSMIDEATGVTGVEQNKIVVASQVRSSLQASGMGQEDLSFYDIGGADLLYELRILSAEQRKSASLYALARKMDVKEYRDLARAMKDHERRKREEGWGSFTFCPGDCLAYSCYRLSKEGKTDVERESFLQKGIEYAETEKARAKLKAFLEKGEDDLQDEESQASRFEVIRLSSSEAGIPSIPYVLPVVEPTVEEFEAAPAVSRKGPFTIQHANTAWKTWVSLPAWGPLMTAVVPVAISFTNAALLPWKQKSRKELEEPIVMVADKHVKGTSENAYYLIDEGDGKVALQRGTVVTETGSRVLGKVVLALRPPLPEEDDINSIEWD
ncbi:hypothetical protein GOP47_0015278 [Adiantum capillus-veneris]|uniref:Uncharacterized protein n=1 Tax=Adiantum capillus-veneris TaxID=13818 RepID=A0A9D4ZCI5_ADICA|nr:hypothetical protein GOP47_0015278 [Adiantum capillus-veneris]